MSAIFISHTDRDKKFVYALSKVLCALNHSVLIENATPRIGKKRMRANEARMNTASSDFIFLFLTPELSESTRAMNSIGFKAGTAAKEKKRLFVFEHRDAPVDFALLYVTDYVLLDENDLATAASLGALAEKIRGMNPPADPLVESPTNVVSGISVGPIGMVLTKCDVIFSHMPPEERVSIVRCPFCKIVFNYYSPLIRRFDCPACRQIILLAPGG